MEVGWYRVRYGDADSRLEAVTFVTTSPGDQQQFREWQENGMELEKVLVLTEEEFEDLLELRLKPGLLEDPEEFIVM